METSGSLAKRTGCKIVHHRTWHSTNWSHIRFDKRYPHPTKSMPENPEKLVLGIMRIDRNSYAIVGN
jgi:hypothetical protein